MLLQLTRINFYLKHKKIIRFLSTQIIPVIFSQKLNNEQVFIIHKKNILLTFLCLKQHIKYQYKLLSCISGVDFLSTKVDSKFRFGVVYDLLSLTFKSRLRIKVYLNEMSTISSVMSIFINANWWEREIWDMFGIWFENHTDLRRILTDYGFDGFPLRKDFPLSGYIDVYYDPDKKRIISKPIELAQEFRVFVFENQW
jgi:NADH dehydrogenase (ubiquinone) Fe-S protein 3